MFEMNEEQTQLAFPSTHLVIIYIMVSVHMKKLSR